MMKGAVAKDIFSKIKNKARTNGDGTEVEVEVRENEEQIIKFQEIVDLLVVAGYFRARIKGLAPFDKVIGGMIWCIECCNFNVDVDFLFQENLTIGQKIPLIEKIVAFLPKMKCPYALEPHQIQGLDFIHIYPVIQWLVRRSMEFREESQDFLYSMGLAHFDRTYPPIESDLKKDELVKKFKEHIAPVKETYKPKRYYKLMQPPPKDEKERVQVTLLEFDYRGAFKKLSDSNVISKQNDDDDNLSSVEHLLKNIKITDEKDDFGSLDESNLLEIQQHYNDLKQEIQAESLLSAEDKQILYLKNEKKSLLEQLNEARLFRNELTDQIDKLNERLDDIEEMKIEAQNRLQKIDQKNSDFLKIESLVAKSEQLKNQEAKFKEEYKLELERLSKIIEKEENEIVASTIEETADMEDKIFEKEQQLHQARLKLAKINRAISYFHRILDNVPTRAELAQYQRRLLEVNNQVSAKYKETKQYFTLYNTLDDTKLYMTKELSILNSILDTYQEAKKSQKSKEEFLKQMQDIANGIQQTKNKVHTKLELQRKQRDQLADELKFLIDLQRKYAQAVRQLANQCKNI